MKVFIRSISSLLLSLLIFSCQSESESKITIAGETVGMYDGLRVYLIKNKADGTQVYIDTAVIVNNTFDFGSMEAFPSTELLSLQMDTAPGAFSFLSENQALYLKVYKDSMMSSLVEGGIDNEQFAAYRKFRVDQMAIDQVLSASRNEAFDIGDQVRIDSIDIKWVESEKIMIQKMEKLIIENPNRIIAPITLEFLQSNKSIDATETRRLYDGMGDPIKEHPISKIIEDRLKKIEVTSIGRKAPYFEGKSPDGTVIKLPEILGKATLVHFWASWCVPCREENQTLVAAYEIYHDKGFNIISASLDKKEEKEKWVNAIEEDQMNWNHISRLAYWRDPIALLYNVNTIPATFLLDDKGIIIAKNPDAASLNQKLEEILN